MLPENDEMLNSLRGPFLSHVRLPDDIIHCLMHLSGPWVQVGRFSLKDHHNPFHQEAQEDLIQKDRQTDRQVTEAFTYFVECVPST